MRHRKHALASAGVASALLALVGGALLAADEEQSEPSAYKVVDGKADPDTVQGYLVYTARCMPLPRA